MKHVSIEGMDGVGKTTVCQLLSQKTGFKFITKPLHYLTDTDEKDWPNYYRARDIANNSDNHNFSAWFYGLGILYSYEKFKNQNIITDRHIVSNYCWSGDSSNMDIFDVLIKKIGVPSLTVILYAGEETIRSRLAKRNSDDSDLKRAHKTEKVYEKMISFCELKRFPYIVVDTTSLTPEQIVNRIMEAMDDVVL